MRSLRAFAISFVLSSILFGIIAYNVVSQAFNITFEVPTLSDSTAQIDVDDQIVDPTRPTKPTKPVTTSKDDSSKKEPTKDTTSKDKDKNDSKDKNQTKQTEDKTPATNAPDLDKIKLPQGKESEVTFLFVSTDYMPSAFNYKSSGYDENGLYVKKRKISVENLLLVKIDRSSQSFMFSSIPGNTLMNQASNKTISDLYNDKGAAYMVDCVYALTGLQVEFFSVIGVDEMTNVFKKLGKVTFDVPCNMQQKDEANKIDVDLKAGVQNLSADMVVDLLRFNNYDEDFIYTRESVHVDFAQAMFEKFTSASYYKKATKLYKDVFSCFESNFSEKEFNNHIDLIFSYREYQSLVVTYPGYESEENGKLVFVPSTGEAISAYEDFK